MDLVAFNHREIYELASNDPLTIGLVASVLVLVGLHPRLQLLSQATHGEGPNLKDLAQRPTPRDVAGLRSDLRRVVTCFPRQSSFMRNGTTLGERGITRYNREKCGGGS